MNIRRPFCFLGILVLAITVSAFNYQKNDNQHTTINDLMTHEEVLDIDLYTNLIALDSLKKTNTYQGATLVFEDAKGKESKWGIKIRTRGKYRRRICERPPLKFNFVKGDLEKAGLKREDELKLVTQCLPGYEGKDYILREYLAYKLFHILSPASFKAQLVRIRYNCTQTGERQRSWGILLEDEKSLARRIDAKICDDCFSKPKEDFSMECLNTATLYQYMIGNTDYSLTMNRNVKLMESKKEKVFRVAPYDFDFSGLVNARYAVPNTDYKQESIRSRVFLGLASDQELKTSSAYFLSKKEEILDYVMGFKLMTKTSRIDIKEYLLEFYTALEQGETVIRPEKLTGQ